MTSVVFEHRNLTYYALLYPEGLFGLLVQAGAVRFGAARLNNMFN
jgi:hypothetical protein